MSILLHVLCQRGPEMCQNFRPAAAYFRNHLPTLHPLVFSRVRIGSKVGASGGAGHRPLLGNDLALAPVSINLRHEISTQHG